MFLLNIAFFLSLKKKIRQDLEDEMTIMNERVQKLGEP